MKKHMGFLSICAFALCSMAFTASSHPPTEKQVHKECTINALNADVADFTIREATLNVEINRYEVIQGIDFVPSVMVSPEPISVNYNLNFEPIAYIQPGKIKTKYHASWLFDPVKTC